jgi:SAM-dependent methyltransferase
MRTRAPAELYALGLDRGELFVRRGDGARRSVPIGRWLGAPTAADRCVLDRAVGPVLDVGCGPGRHLLALTRRGVPALGVDIAAAAVRRARGRGARAVLASVFDPLPGTGGWRTVLLLDGNVGIGGRPVALLTRLRSLLATGGVILCEVDPPGSETGDELIALEDSAGRRSVWFAWARVSIDGLPSLARDAGLHVRATWHEDGRWFAALSAELKPENGTPPGEITSSVAGGGARVRAHGSHTAPPNR